MSIPMTTSSDDGDDGFEERWRQWQRTGAIDARRSEIRVRIVFAVVVGAAIAWFGFQLL